MTLRTGSILMLAGLSAALASCGKHGAYTQAHKDQAEARLNEIKSATDWDMARQQFEAGDLERALRTADSSIGANPKIGKTHMLRGRILLEMGRIEEALPALDESIKLDPKAPEPLYFRGVALERVGRREQALASYKGARELKPDEVQYTVAAAEMLIEMNRLDAARELLENDSTGMQYSPGVRQTLGHIAMIQGDVSRAVEHFSEAVVLGADSPPLLEDLARAQIAAGRFSDAETTLTRLRANPDQAERRDLLHLQARCLLELGRPVDARQILQQLIGDEKHANDVDAWVRLGDVALILGDDHQLRSVANRLISIAPDRFEGYMSLAMWQKRTGDLPGALRSADRAVERTGTSKGPGQLRQTIKRELDARGDQASASAVPSR
jgi:tetratricopeptide (TPR) repeat protein